MLWRMQTYTRMEAARLVGVSLRTIDRLLATRELPCACIGRRVVVLEEDLVDLLRRRRRVPNEVRTT